MRECDLIMKGGITSGVVYPKAITTIAKQYRLRSIGGTSAGAIAAVLAGAAEYRRQTKNDNGGLKAIESVAKDFGNDMASLFQPAPKMARLHGVMFKVLACGDGQSKSVAAVRGVIRHYRVFALAGLLITIVLAELTGLGLSFAEVLFAAFGAIILSAISMAVVLFWDLFKGLTAHDFGLCPGTTQQGYEKPALTNWLTDKIDEVAGHDCAGPPLTQKDLKRALVHVATMTTDLATKRPYQLPLLTDDYLFSKADFDRLFPKRVVDFMISGKTPLLTNQPDVPDDLYQLPKGDDFPVILIARFSLSFPGLISAVPLWCEDKQLSRVMGEVWLARCLFSDGGISSNFPVHLFDAPLPSRPTFGISLTRFERARHGETRVSLPKKGRPSTDLPVRPPLGLLGFAMSILDASKDWQDMLQSLLPGTADRIVEIRLDDNEGGMNLTMSETEIATLIGYGESAGQKLVSEFDFEEHRWQRALAVMPAMHHAMGKVNKAYYAKTVGAPDDGLNYSQVLRDYPVSYQSENSPEWRKNELDAYAQTLAELGREDGVGNGLSDGLLPDADAFVRLVADANHTAKPAE